MTNSKVEWSDTEKAAGRIAWVSAYETERATGASRARARRTADAAAVCAMADARDEAAREEESEAGLGNDDWGQRFCDECWNCARREVCFE